MCSPRFTGLSAMHCGPALRDVTERVAGQRMPIAVVHVHPALTATRLKLMSPSFAPQMSWDLALPFGSPVIEEMSSKYKVSGIPTLLIFDAATGEMVTAGGWRRRRRRCTRTWASTRADRATGASLISHNVRGYYFLTAFIEPAQ